MTILAGLIFTSLTSSVTAQQSKPLVSQSKMSQDSSSAATSVFEQVSQSVVIVVAISPVGKVQGSGVVYDSDRSILTKDGEADEIPARLPDKLFSYVVTNAHVVQRANSVLVLQGGKRCQADAYYVDDESDLALLYVHGDLLLISPPFSGTQLKVGEKVFAIGSPFGLENTISEGIISGKREQNGVLLLQTTAAVSPGNSGGGLFDSKGRFVGITTFKLRGGENLNFAVDAGRIYEIGEARAWSRLLRVNLLKMNVTTQFSVDQMALINSGALTEWVLKTRDENGEKLCTKMEHLWPGLTADPSVMLAARKELLKIVKQFLSDQAGDTSNMQNKPEKVLMVCSVASEKGTYRHDESFTMDYTNRTVNGHPAQFTDAEIWWIETRENTKYVHTLNRYSASIQIGSERFPNLMFGHCSPAAERKF